MPLGKYLLVLILCHTEPADMMSVKLVCKCWSKTADTDTYYTAMLNKLSPHPQMLLLAETFWGHLPWPERFRIRRRCLRGPRWVETYGGVEVEYWENSCLRREGNCWKVYTGDSVTQSYKVFPGGALGWCEHPSGVTRRGTFRDFRMHGKCLSYGKHLSYGAYNLGECVGPTLYVRDYEVVIVDEDGVHATWWTRSYLFQGWRDSEAFHGTFYRPDGTWTGVYEAPDFWGLRIHGDLMQIGHFVNWVTR
jgi:hypothetical protein